MRLFAITPDDGRDLGPWVEALDPSPFTDLIVRESTAAILPPTRLRLWHHERTPGPPLGPPHLRASGSPPDGPFGISCHDRAELDRAFAAGAVYALLSPVFPPTSKPEDRRVPLGVARFTALAAGRAVVALGGITPERAHELRAAGAWGAAVLGDVFHRPLDGLAPHLERYSSAPSSGSSNTNSCSS